MNMANKEQKRFCAIISVEINSDDFFKAQEKIEQMNEEVFDTYHGSSNILGLFEEAK